MGMSPEQIAQVSDHFNPGCRGDDWILENAGPKGAALQLVADRLLSLGWSRKAIALTAVTYRLKAGGNLPSRPSCLTAACPVRGYLSLYLGSDALSEFFPSKTDDPGDLEATRLSVVAQSLSINSADLDVIGLAIAEVFPGDLANIRDAWVAHAASKAYPGVTTSDIEMAADTLNLSVGLAPFVSLNPVAGCKGSSCPGVPKIVN